MEKYHYKELEEAEEIETPYLNHLNDRIRIYLSHQDGEKMILSDDGLTFNELDMMGIDLQTKTRKRLVEDIQNQFNVQIKNDIIFVETSKYTFPQDKHDLMQAILKLYDLTVTSTPNIKNLFNEEVAAFLFDNEIYGSQSSVQGDSGIKHTVDYHIAPTKSTPEMFVNIKNNINYDSMTAIAYANKDIKSIRKSPNGLVMEYKVIVNDTEKSIPEKVLSVAENDGIEILRWSDKEILKEKLKIRK